VAAVLERFLIDMTVLSPERLVYEAGAQLGPGLEQRRTAPIVVPGGVLDLDAIEATVDQTRLAEANRTADRKKIRRTQEVFCVEFVESEGEFVGKDAKTVARSRVRDCENGILQADHPIHMKDGGVILAGEINEKHIGAECLDPQEPDYDGGRFCAQILNGSKGLRINSFAHGRTVYSIASAGGIAGARTLDEEEDSNPQSLFTRSLYSVAEETGRKKLKPVSALARLMSNEWSDIRYNLGTASFWEYSGGCWVELDPLLVERRIFEAIELTGIGFSPEAISGSFKMLSSLKVVKKWGEPRGLIPMLNGVLDIATKNLLPHSPDYGFRWRLPYAYNPIETCEPIQEWLEFAQDGDPQRVQLLRAFLKAVITGRTDLQRFLEAVGPGGTGKSTFANLAIALVGVENCHVSELKRLEKSPFETANIYGKRLVYITDAERYAGGVATFKSLTGGDPLPFERKYLNAGHFTPTAVVILCANEAIVSSDNTSGLERRRLTVPFTQRVAPGERRDLLTINEGGISGEFAEYLPGLFNWVMAIDDNDVRNLVVNTLISVPSLNTVRGETLIASNSIAEWLDSECVFVQGVKSRVGVADKLRITDGPESRDTFDQSQTLLYPNYVQFCSLGGVKPYGHNRFSLLVTDLCHDQLGNLEVVKDRDRNGVFIHGLALRYAPGTNYSDLPRPITGALDRVEEPVEYEFEYPEAA
jgi:P4 family phage/plasmid primase-like protien